MRMWRKLYQCSSPFYSRFYKDNMNLAVIFWMLRCAKLRTTYYRLQVKWDMGSTFVGFTRDLCLCCIICRSYNLQCLFGPRELTSQEHHLSLFSKCVQLREWGVFLPQPFPLFLFFFGVMLVLIKLLI